MINFYSLRPFLLTIRKFKRNKTYIFLQLKLLQVMLLKNNTLLLDI